MEKRRYANIDLLKTCAILMVIILHSQIYNINFIENFKISTIMQYFFRIITEGVPIFIVVNGYLLLNKKDFELKKHIKKMLKIFFILIIWSFILTILIKLIYNEKLVLKEIIKNVLITNINNKYTGILWFLQNLIALYLIYPILKNTHDTNKNIYNYIFIILMINTIFVNLFSLISQMIETKIKFDYINIFTTYIGNFQILSNRNFLIFFMLGGYLYEYKEKFENKKIRMMWITIGIIAWIIALLYAIIMSKLQNKTYGENFNYNTIFILLNIIGIYALTYKYQYNNKWYNKLITCISKNTLGIYLVHILIIKIINRIYLGPNSLLFKGTKVLITFFLSFFITIIIKKIPKIKKIIEI